MRYHDVGDLSSVYTPFATWDALVEFHVISIFLFTILKGITFVPKKRKKKEKTRIDESNFSLHPINR